MKLRIKISFIVLLLCTVQLVSCKEEREEPVALLLTWQHDPTTTMTVDWHTTPDNSAYNRIQYKMKGEKEWIYSDAITFDFPHSDRKIHRVELTELVPASYYEFKVGEFSRMYKFRTMPENLNSPLRFIAGGDTHHERHTMSAQAMLYDPDFIVWGGDLVYCDGDPARVHWWYSWFKGLMDNLISEEGRVVPIIAGIGNHEVFSRNNLRAEGGRYPHEEMTEAQIDDYVREHDLYDGKGTFYFELFAFPGEPAYNVLDFSDYLSIVLLDSGHNADIEGEQTEWLNQILSDRTEIPHLFPVYHVPAYPSYRSYTHSRSVAVRTNWVTLFEEHGVRVAFENHDHTYKRTYPIRNGEIAPDGIVYIGDGNWGRGDRASNNSDAWYIQEFAGNRRHGIVVTLHGTHQHFLVVDEHGEVLDEYPEIPVILHTN